MQALAVLILVGAIGGLVGVSLRLPAGILVGAMTAVILFKAFGATDYTVPRAYIYVVQVLVGVMIGVGYTPEVAGMILQLIRPVLISTLVLVGAGLAVGLVFSRTLCIDPVTGYLATSPGGLSALIPLAAEANGLPTVVAAFHFFRLVFILLTAPLVLKLIQAWATRCG